MTKKVVIRGPWHETDREHIENSEDLQIVHSPHLNSSTDIASFIETSKKADLVIMALFGANLDSHFENTELLPFLYDINIRKVYWTQDAQHEWGMGVKYQKYFRRYYLNYSDSMSIFDNVETCWLPSCFFSMGIDDLIELIRFPKETERDVIFPYVEYGLDDRSLVVKRIESKLLKYGLNYYLGEIEGGLHYLQSLQETRICLNISTLGSLNIRNFEVLALNRILLAEKVKDHDRITMDLSHTYFFRRDLSDFDEALKQALNDNSNSIRTANNIINHHMLVHRYVEIINNELNAYYKVRLIDIQTVEGAIQTVINIKHLVESEKLGEAQKFIEQAVEKYPHSPYLLNLKGELMLQLGQVEEATKLFFNVKDRWPYYIETLNNIAFILCLEKNWDSARKLLYEALKLRPSHKSILKNLKSIENEISLPKAKNYIQRGNYAEAISILKKIIASDEQHIEALNQLALIYIRTGNLKEAEKKLSLVFQEEPNNEEALHNLHYLLQQKKDAK